MSAATPPRDRSLDSSRALRADPYRFISRRCERLGTDVFRTRILLRPTLCMRGREAAELFYDPGRFIRAGAAPELLRATLFGKGAIQSLDGAEHQARKRLFMQLMAPERVAELTEIFVAEWRTALDDWAARDRVSLYEALHPVLTKAVCRWAGVPLAQDELVQRTHELVPLFDSAGEVGAGHLASRRARRRGERWLTEWIVRTRRGEGRTRADRQALASNSLAHAVATLRGANGRLLPPRIAAVELLNVLRPVVAVSVYIVQAAHALQLHPEWRDRLREPGGEVLEPFVQEVRRFYPFFPAIIARTRQSFEWHGLRFPAHTRVMLDVYGTNHDPRTWRDPHRFDPERFAKRGDDAYEPISQGGGDASRGHRCPGERITLELCKAAVQVLVSEITYDVPSQDLEIDMARLPALPKDHFVISAVRRQPAATLTMPFERFPPFDLPIN